MDRQALKWYFDKSLFFSFKVNFPSLRVVPKSPVMPDVRLLRNCTTTGSSIPGVKTKTALWVPDTTFFEANTDNLGESFRIGLPELEHLVRATVAPAPFVQAIALTWLALETFLKTAIKNILLSMRRFVSVFRLSV